MIRFNCPSCQKVLNAPDDKAGKRFACPGCKKPVDVPASSSIQAKPAAPSTMSGEMAAAPTVANDAPPASFGSRFGSECLGIVVATFRQTLKPITYIFEVFRRTRLRRKAGDAQFVLGQRLYDAKIGDPKLRARIQSLGERIHSIQDVKGDAKSTIAERRDLIQKLAEPVLTSTAAPPEAVAGEYERAHTLKVKLAAQEEALAGAFGGLLPPNAVAWRRVIIGYTLVVLAALGGLQIYLSGRPTQAQLDLLAAQQGTEEKRKQEDAEWGKKRDVAEIVEKCAPSVAKISYKLKFGDKESGGTGFMIRPGVIATNAHVIDSALAEDMEVYYPSAKGLEKTPMALRVIYFDRKRDLAFLAVEPKVPALRLPTDFEFKSGHAITVIGCPGFDNKLLQNVPTPGLLGTKTDVDNQPFYQLSIEVNPGNSGGPVFDNRGQVIGVVTLKASQQGGLAFCIPLEELKSRLEGLEKEDPNKVAASAQLTHGMHVVAQRLFLSSIFYSNMMEGYALAMVTAGQRGLTPAAAAREARAVLEEILREAEPFMLDGKHQAVGKKLLADPAMPADLKQKATDLWQLHDELRGHVEKPSGSIGAYLAKHQQLEQQVLTRVKALAEALDMDIPLERRRRPR